MTRDFRDTEEKRLAEELVATECEFAASEKEPFHSDYEAWAVLREEVYEAWKELKTTRIFMDDLDPALCVHSYPPRPSVLEYVEEAALRGIVEMAHVAAAARKWRASLGGERKC